ncbi:hypothetical protein E2K98_28310 [Bacillus salipaludis]|uniref:Uncharacterized protein n=1 Tax=Bacillus salipaludis TaxID=2547811 RepID=A0A4R5VIR0_9BACI|nr:hypothetical protein [Bacillus salipaludis]MDQ6597850.1 hypothetical protein [Bacillus salipaludis]TDK55403.1 hypothetical protein E2K98_28310 [Bacillus salipaludis]
MRKISDYYLSDATYEGQALIVLITDLEKYKLFINEKNKVSIKVLLMKSPIQPLKKYLSEGIETKGFGHIQLTGARVADQAVKMAVFKCDCT